VRLAAVVKVGGSLLGSPTLPDLLRTLGTLAGQTPLVVVPGGGPFADAVRAACARADPGVTAAHFMAILAMDQCAHYLGGLVSGAALVSEPEGIEKALASGALPLLAPYAWLYSEDPLPHGWHVTSDSIAAWVAARLLAPRVVLLKSIDGVQDASGGILPRVPRAAAGEVVDSYFPEALADTCGCWIVNGCHPERVAELFREGTTRGTELL
jgi:aspartokinase-like uncharacterized kinase